MTTAPAVRSEDAPAYTAGPTTARERLRKHGPERLADHELLALIGVDIDGAGLEALGGLRALLDNPEGTLRPVSDVHRARITAFHALHARWMEAHLERDGTRMTSPEAVRRYLAARLRGLDEEVFGILYLDTPHRVLCCKVHFQGTINAARVHPRVIVRQALIERASACIAFHNHPSGEAEPSTSDRETTDRLKTALATIDVTLLDHLIIGDTEVVSMAERGWLV